MLFECALMRRAPGDFEECAMKVHIKAAAGAVAFFGC